MKMFSDNNYFTDFVWKSNMLLKITIKLYQFSTSASFKYAEIV